MMYHSAPRFLLFIAISFATLSSIVHASVVVDQVSSGRLPGLQTIGTVGQTFTVGASGRLDSVDILVQTTTEVLFDIRPVDASGFPSELSASALYSTTLPNTADAPQLFSFDVSGANIMVNSGDMFALVASVQNNGILRWASEGSTANQYAGGRAFSQNNSTKAWRTSFDSDLYFTTRVDITAIPEPSHAIVLLAGLVGTMMLSRRNRVV